MIRTLALLCLVAAPAFAAFKADLQVKFEKNINGSTSLMHLPITIAEAISTGWVLKTRPTLPLAIGYESLVMYGPVDDNTVNLFFDVDTTYVYGLQIGLDKGQVEYLYNYEAHGFTTWTAELSDGTTRDYWTIQQYFSSAEYLATDAAVRNASRNTKTLIQGSKMTVSGFNGKLLEISTDPSVIADTTASGFTEEACMPSMGQYFYYNITSPSSTSCNKVRVLPWFPLVSSGDLIGIVFEHEPKPPIEVLGDNPTECLYGLVDSPFTVIIMHIYFIDTPPPVYCNFE